MSEQIAIAHKLSEYAFAAEECEKTKEVLNFLRNTLGTCECENNKTFNFLEGYAAAMKRIVRQAEL